MCVAGAWKYRRLIYRRAIKKMLERQNWSNSKALDRTLLRNCCCTESSVSDEILDHFTLTCRGGSWRMGHEEAYLPWSKAANQGAIQRQGHSLSDNAALKVIHSKPDSPLCADRLDPVMTHQSFQFFWTPYISTWHQLNFPIKVLFSSQNSCWSERSPTAVRWAFSCRGSLVASGNNRKSLDKDLHKRPGNELRSGILSKICHCWCLFIFSWFRSAADRIQSRVWFGEGGGRTRGRQGEGGAADRKKLHFWSISYNKRLWSTMRYVSKTGKMLEGFWFFFVWAFYFNVTTWKLLCILSLQKVQPKIQVIGPRTWIDCFTQVGHNSELNSLNIKRIQ